MDDCKREASVLDAVVITEYRAQGWRNWQLAIGESDYKRGKYVNEVSNYKASQVGFAAERLPVVKRFGGEVLELSPLSSSSSERGRLRELPFSLS